MSLRCASRPCSRCSGSFQLGGICIGPRRLHRDVEQDRRRSESRDPATRARHTDARTGWICAEEAAGGAEESRQGPGAARKGVAASRQRHPCGSLCGSAGDRRKSRRTTTPSARHCGCSPPMPRPRRYSRRCCATKTNCARIGRSRLLRCIRWILTSCSRTRARSCSTSRTIRTSRRPA